jgi:hypothetical protein
MGPIDRSALDEDRGAETSMMHALLSAVVAAAGWSTPQVLSNGSIALGPELSMTPSGSAIAVWDHESGPDCAQSPGSLTCAHIVEFSERPSPLGWSYPVDLARPGIGARPHVALNGAGRAAVIWVHDIGRDRVVQATYRTATNERFPNPNDLSAAVLEVREHEVGLDAAGNAAVVWAERHDKDFDVAGEIRSVQNGTWGAPVVLSTANATAGPSLAVTPAGEAFAIWLEGTSVLVARGDLEQGRWDAPVTLGSDAGSGAAIAVNSAGDALAVWTLVGASGIEAALRPSGGTWHTEDAHVDNGPAAATAGPSVTLAPDGAAVAVWVASAMARYAWRSPDGTWSRPLPIAAADSAEPRVAIDPLDDAIATWLQGGRLVAAARPAAAGAWQPVEELSGADVSGPEVALDAAGRGVAVWNLAQGDSLPVMTSTFPAAGWTPTLANTRRPAIRGRPRVGRTLTCTRGDWAGTIPIGYAFTWLRNGRVRARGVTYRVRSADSGTQLACRVAATNVARTAVATSPTVRVKR